ncbi:uncharacterized protein Osi7 [Euwallacea similis]|uniref:uncharacterized protein Osi7 n=1 Tax=Euwallacea similis TaxID=1736056 RepID=UPI00344B41F1
MNFKILSVLLCVAVVSQALPTQEEARSNTIQTESDLLDAVYTDCLRKDSLSCLKYKIYNFVDKTLGQRDSITVTDGVQIIKTSNDKDGAPRAISSDDSIESLVFDRVARWLETHTIKVDLKGSEIVNAVQSTARSFSDVISEEEGDGVEEGRKKKKKGGHMGPLMGALALKAAVLGKLALWAIAVIAGKALLIGKIALVLSSIIGIKKLLASQNHGKHVTYEVVSHPQHTSSHVSTHEVAYAGSSGHGGDLSGGSYGGSGHGGWGRSLDAQQLAYRGQQPEIVAQPQQ